MKGKLRFMSVVIFSLGLVLTGCSAKSDSQPTPSVVEATDSHDKIKVQVSFYPMYEFTKQVAGDLADVESLIPAGIEPHDWEPTPQDMKKLEEADVFVYNGAGLEGWTDQVLASLSNKQLVQVEASHGLDIMESTSEEEGHDHEHAHDGEAAAHDHKDEGTAEVGHDHAHDHGGLDPHVWLSPVLAIQEVRNIEQGLAQAAPGHKDGFKKNADAYVAQLEQLDQDFKDGLANVKRKEFITQHAAFGYLAKQYGLTQIPIAGLSPDQEPSASQMADIVAFAKAHDAKTIFFETLVSSKVADTIAKEIGAKTAVLNPIEGLTDEDLANNLDYLGIMRQNLEALKAALSA
ncbi:ABC transporter substrate-binding protein [Paenibacillus selenitireducens]|uniref:ABC transporter substrate-binding protein n=1 Tax=Paenibacillus selenitireducens TaxID=1324314 RepID=A0A1T2XMZ5_9BACL|nr:metal ABC transporter substrate-binding protein [Paenibacillus selenitireducens]OPA81234.1 ABC transporter substrate-binding protein [Paenibacillus selenitireducens]